MSQWVSLYGSSITAPVHTVSLTKGTAKYEEPWPCGRCGGAGGAQKWEYTGWTCYACGGDGGRGRTRTRSCYTPEKYAKLEAARAKRSAAKQAKHLAAAAEREAIRKASLVAIRAEFDTVNPGFYERLDAAVGIDEHTSFKEEESFLGQMLVGLSRFGSLTPNQLAATIRVLDKRDADARSQWVGAVGEKMTLTLTVDRVIIPEQTGPIPSSWTFLCHDDKGNKIVYRGRSNAMPDDGMTSILTAKVREHSMYNGVRQTVIERPKLVSRVEVIEVIESFSQESPDALGTRSARQQVQEELAAYVNELATSPEVLRHVSRT